MYKHILVLIPGLFAILHVNSPSWHASALICVKVWITWKKKQPRWQKFGKSVKRPVPSFETAWNVVIVQTQNQKRTSEQYHEWLVILYASPNVGLEPTTTRLRVLRSADWANRANVENSLFIFSSIKKRRRPKGIKNVTLKLRGVGKAGTTCT